VPADLHLFGVDRPARVPPRRDETGRDEWTRVLFGAQVSLHRGARRIVISFTLGLLLGGASGYFGGWTDTLIMRSTELLLSIPGLYLIVALRGAFRSTCRASRPTSPIVAILSLIGWAGLARVIRGMVLSLRGGIRARRARARRLEPADHRPAHPPEHALVHDRGRHRGGAGYILGEVALSFLGVGVQPPAASWATC